MSREAHNLKEFTVSMLINFSSLPKLGINPLTGEACAYMMRILCDLNEEGVALVSEFFSLRPDALNPNWNSRVDDKPAVASIMLTNRAMPELVRFALWRRGYQYILGTGDSVAYCAFSDTDIAENPAYAQYLDGSSYLMQDGRHTLYRNPRIPGQPSVGSRNVHGFSGRVE